MPLDFAPIGVTRLTLTDFRCYAHLRLEADLRPIVLTGPNGAGKTNLLEAVSFLAPGRGLRRAKLSEVTRIGAHADSSGEWGVAALLHTPGGAVEIGTGRLKGAAERRIVRIDGRTAPTQAALGEHVSTIWLTPALDRLFTDVPGERRRFFDRLVYGLHPEHAARLAAYTQACRQRARLLREQSSNRAWYEALEARMAREGVAVAVARRDVAFRLGRILETPQDDAFPAAALTLSGTVETWLNERPEPQAEDDFRALLAAARPQELGGAPGDGPHRTDFLLVHGARKTPASVCSTGEQKALLISLLLAQARLQAVLRGSAPLLLFDEVAAHLDEARRAALFAALLSLGAQAWMSGTEKSLFAPLGDRAQFFNVCEGRLH